MSHSFPPDVQQMIDGQLASGRYASELDVLRSALLVLRQVDDDAMAVQAAVDDWKSGDDGLTVDDAFNLVREEWPRKPTE